MPKSGDLGPTYAGHVNVAPEGVEPEWVLEQAAPAVPVEPVVEAKPDVKPADKAEDRPDARRRTRGR